MAPIISIDIEGPNGVVPKLYAIMDSGADKSLLPKALMASFGIDDADCTDVPGNTANGTTNYRAWNGGSTNWNHGKLKTTMLGVEISLNAWFADCPIVLLGREDFFCHFRVTFDERKKQVKLETN